MLIIVINLYTSPKLDALGRRVKGLNGQVDLCIFIILNERLPYIKASIGWTASWANADGSRN